MELTDREKDLIYISVLNKFEELICSNDKYKLDNNTKIVQEYKEILNKLKGGK